MNKYINYLKTKAILARNSMLDATVRTYRNPAHAFADIEQKINNDGIALIPDFLDSSTCQTLITEIDDIISSRPTDVWTDNLEADHRIWGMNNVSDIAQSFYHHPTNAALRESYYALEDKYLDGFVMANRIKSVTGNLGSGGGWHRDVVNEKQLKCIVYLTDVNEDNGPFQYILGTHHKSSVLKSILDHDFGFNHNRFTDEEVDKILAYPEYRSRVFTANAGTMIVTDTSGIHRGMPIQNGVRYALTNYCWVSPLKGGNGIPKKIRKILIN